MRLEFDFVGERGSAHVLEEFEIFFVFSDFDLVREEVAPQRGQEFILLGGEAVFFACYAAVQILKLSVDGFKEGKEVARVYELVCYIFLELVEQGVECALEGGTGTFLGGLAQDRADDGTNGCGCSGGRFEKASFAEPAVNVADYGIEDAVLWRLNGLEFAAGPFHGQEDAGDG